MIVNLSSGRTNATIEVLNRSATPVAVQARAFSWSQPSDTDVLTPTDDFIISPPIFTVPAGATQTMRLLLRRGTDAAERSYRLLIDEVPAATDRQQVAISLRLSLPVMSSPATPGLPLLTWTIDPSAAGGHTTLSVSNTGATHTKVNAIAVTLSDGGRRTVAPVAANPYVLAGAQRLWTVDGAPMAHGVPFRLTVTTPQGKTEQTLTP